MATKLEELKWLAVDLDGTLAHTEAPDYTLGDPIASNVEKLHKCVQKGYKVVIHTARHWEQYNVVEEWLNKHEIPYKAIVCGKLLAHRYIDDRAIPADAEWEEWL